MTAIENRHHVMRFIIIAIMTQFITNCRPTEVGIQNLLLILCFSFLFDKEIYQVTEVELLNTGLFPPGCYFLSE